MLVTAEQRRWWFANHPEYSSSKKGKKNKRKSEKRSVKKEKGSEISPKEVDEYVDEALKYRTGSVEREILKQAKALFGTESEQNSKNSYLESDEDYEYGEWEEEDDFEVDYQETERFERAADKSYSRDYRRVVPKDSHLYSVQSLLARRRQELAERMAKIGSGAVEPDPHTLFDILPYRRFITSPISAIRGLFKSSADRYILNAVKKGGSGRPPRRLPPKGAPEYNKIQRDRQQGIKLKKEQEMEDILAGGEGSGIWDEADLEYIRKYKEFPKGIAWHHRKTVANRPDLASDPNNVIPIRGGREEHLRDGHFGDWRKPLEDE